MSGPEGAAGPAAEPPVPDAVRAELATLRVRLGELEEALAAVGAGRADALVVGLPGAERVVTLGGADLPFRAMVEHLGAGAATLSRDGTVLFANRQLGQLLGAAVTDIVGADLVAFAAPTHQDVVEDLLRVDVGDARREEVALITARGVARALVATTALRLDDLTVVCCVATDVTELRSLETQLAAERRNAVQRAERLRMAMEVNDTIVQGLVAAETAFDLDQPAQARAFVASTSRRARDLIGDLLDDDLWHGMVRREAAARIGEEVP